MTLTHYIEQLRAKPQQVRERIALGLAVGITALVSLAWLVTLAATGAFALAPQERNINLAQITPTAAEATQVGTNFSQLLGAVGAGIASTAKPSLVVETNTTSSLERAPAPEATVIPF